MLHDFTKGKSANYLIKKRSLSFEVFRNVELSTLEGIPFDPKKIEVDENGFAIYKDGEERMLLFYYKKYFYLNWGGVRKLPKYHVTKCETRVEYTGFYFANKMPVQIFDKKTHHATWEGLDLCKNCSRQIFKSWWPSNKPWYESVLHYLEHEIKPVFQSDGYHSMWRQVSEAYRESIKFKCEDCGVDLSSSDERKWLHTHHRNGEKRNNSRKNFQGLCLLCHALCHKYKIERGKGFEEVEDFIQLFEKRLSLKKLTEFKQIRQNRP